MKVKALKNFFLFDGTKLEIDSEYEIKDEIAKDLINGNFVKQIEEVKKPTTRKKKVVMEGE